ncbi:unnamed protein product [marine sediment metagenome]|uniref:Type II secretion system protein GspG C-terminal domain-containing protein n=1 Tax=marine sediment metagenome TaxID=412755 RepID=X1JMD3_9ZZZZ
MKRFLKSFRYGEKGFTLIELLVVVAILGVLAAVVVPNVGRFMGAGTVEAANTEAHNVQTAVLAYMVDNSLSTITNGGEVGPSVDIPSSPDYTGTTVKSFITGILQAKYTISPEGEITGATTTDVTDSKWTGLSWDATKGWYK